MQEEINKYLTEAITGRSFKEYPAFTNLTTWEGFGKLWEWARNQEWWRDFAGQWEYLDSSLFTKALDEMINPETFANSVYDFLNK